MGDIGVLGPEVLRAFGWILGIFGDLGDSWVGSGANVGVGSADRGIRGPWPLGGDRHTVYNGCFSRNRALGAGGDSADLRPMLTGGGSGIGLCGAATAVSKASLRRLAIPAFLHSCICAFPHVCVVHFRVPTLLHSCAPASPQTTVSPTGTPREGERGAEARTRMQSVHLHMNYHGPDTPHPAPLRAAPLPAAPRRRRPTASPPACRTAPASVWAAAPARRSRTARPRCRRRCGPPPAGGRTPWGGRCAPDPWGSSVAAGVGGTPQRLLAVGTPGPVGGGSQGP